MSRHGNPLYHVQSEKGGRLEPVYPDSGGPRFVDVLFNLGTATTDGVDGLRLNADNAAIILTRDAEGEWPSASINEILAVIYEKSAIPTIPQLYPIRGNGRVIGYMAAARNDNRTGKEWGQLFWTLTQYCNLATKDNRGLRTTCVPGSWCWAFDDDSEDHDPEDPDDKGLPIGAVVFEDAIEGGLPIPTRAVNYALRMLCTQPTWPRKPLERLYTYPYRRGEGTSVSGLVLAPSVDGFGDNELVDDVWIERTQECNLTPDTILQFPENLRPWRFQ